MRKLIAALIAAVMMIGAVAAMAETTPEIIESTVLTATDVELLEGLNVPAGTTLDITVTAPAGYQTDTVPLGPDHILVEFTPVDGETTIYALQIAYSELLGDFTLTDLTDEQFAEATATLAADYANPLVDISRTTGYGTRLIVIAEQGSESSFVDIITVYHGYFIQVAIFDENDAITENEIQTGVDILTSLALNVELPAAE